MGERRPVQVLVEVEETGSTVRGLISVAGGEPSGFFGWLELIDRLGAAASEAQTGEQSRTAIRESDRGSGLGARGR